MERTLFNQAVHDPSLIFMFLVCLELVWNAGRIILVCISIRYYFVIIKEVRQITTIHLSDFTDSAATEFDQEFHEEMMNEYPGHGHKDNVKWYYTSTLSFVFTILLDMFAALSVHFQSYFSLLVWLCFYIAFSIFEITATVLMMRKCTNRKYFKRKWGHCAFMFTGCTIFRLYLIWLCQDLPFTSSSFQG